MRVICAIVAAMCLVMALCNGACIAVGMSDPFQFGSFLAETSATLAFAFLAVELFARRDQEGESAEAPPPCRDTFRDWTCNLPRGHAESHQHVHGIGNAGSVKWGRSNE